MALEDSLPGPAPFGRSSNFAGSVATRLGLKPALTIYEVLGGQSPQKIKENAVDSSIAASATPCSFSAQRNWAMSGR